ncbi:MAG: hypothetical protein PHG44_07280 [Lentisphaeria bacterium]|nr:hypothetical protein [Lentisphaeria bacterium]
MFVSKKTYAGLDIGSFGTKTVLLERSGKGFRLLSCQHSSHASEGVLSESELYQEAGLWLKEHAPAQTGVGLGIPQYYGNSMLANFPDGSKAKVRQLVAFETRQLAGISEAAFIEAYQALPAFAERKNPVLICICNENVLQERLQLFREYVGLELQNTALNGIAVLNAYLELCAEDAKDDTKPVLLLDLGQSSSSAIICCGGAPLYISSLTFAAERFDKAIQADDYRHLDENSWQKLADFDFFDDEERSPMLLAARQLEDEIQQIVEHWRELEGEALAKTPMRAVYVCGGASRIGNLLPWLEKYLDVPVHLFGPSWESEPRAEFCCAYGLALQAAGLARLDLSLLPPELRWQKQRQKRFPLLMIALAVLFVAFAYWQCSLYFSLNRDSRRLSRLTAEMEVSGALIDQLDQLQKSRQSYADSIGPLLASSWYVTRLQDAITAMAKACDPEDCFVFLGDETRFFAQEKAKEKAQNKPRSTPSAGGLFGIAQPTASSGDSGSEAAAAEFPLRLGSMSEPHDLSFICLGFTPFVPGQPYEQVRRIVRHLQAEEAFPGTDILPEQMRARREDIIRPWQQLFRQLPDAQFRPFAFKMPLRQSKGKTRPRQD